MIWNFLQQKKINFKNFGSLFLKIFILIFNFQVSVLGVDLRFRFFDTFLSSPRTLRRKFSAWNFRQS